MPWASIKMMERVGKSPDSTKTTENVELLTDCNLGNIQKTTPNKHLLNANLLRRHDHLGGHSSKVCIGDTFFHKNLLFLKKNLDNKQTNKLLNSNENLQKMG